MTEGHCYDSHHSMMGFGLFFYARGPTPVDMKDPRLFNRSCVRPWSAILTITQKATPFHSIDSPAPN